MNEFLIITATFVILFLIIYSYIKHIKSQQIKPKYDKKTYQITNKEDNDFLTSYKDKIQELSKIPKASLTDIGKYLFFDLRSSNLHKKNNNKQLNCYVTKLAWLLVDKDGFQVSGGNYLINSTVNPQGSLPAEVYADFLESVTDSEFIISYDIEYKLDILEHDLIHNGFTQISHNKKKVCLKSIAKLYLENEKYSFCEHNNNLEKLFFQLYFGITSFHLDNADNPLSDVLLSYRCYMRIKDELNIVVDDEEQIDIPYDSFINAELKSEPVDCDFVAIDFETATGKRNSACQLGIVVVKRGEIVEQKCYLIKPPKNEYNIMNTRIHGISATTTTNAFTFEELWPEIKLYINDITLVAHNASFDIDVLYKTCEYYGIKDLYIKEYNCTYELTGLALIEAAQAFGIEVEGHHDALQDAIMCADIYTNISNGKSPDLSLIKVEKGGKKESDKEFVKHCFNSNTTIFEGKGVLITGVFGSFNREDIQSIIRNKGGILKSSISSKVDFVIMGLDAGPVKIKKIAELKEKGHPIQVLNEEEFLKIISK